jgi:Kef-type K+ transport system membrane component KefB/mannitol/fructose-specific phosphotransferase system IIA component (Ntr-type)
MLLSVALLIGVARLLGELARRWHQPAILGELLAGVLLGPTVLGTFAPDVQSFLFPREGSIATFLEGIGSLAIVLFLLVAGMEVDLSIVWKQSRSALKVGTLGTVVPFAIGAAAAAIVPQALGQQVDADPVVFSLFMGTAIAISALPVIAKTLMDLDLYRTDFGMVIVSAAIFNDLIGWTVFSLILAMMDSHSSSFSVLQTTCLTVSLAVFMLTIGRWSIHRTLPFLQAYTHYPGGVLGFAVTLGLLGAAATEFAGIHAIFGAFLVGVALGDSTHLSERTRVLIDEFVSFIFAPLFFASIGLKVNFVSHFDLGLVALVLAVATIGKLAGAVTGARWAGYPVSESWAIGFAMNARGAMEIILGTLALEAGIIRQPLFVALVIMAIATSALSGPLIKRLLQLGRPLRLATTLTPALFVRNLRGETRADVIHELAELAGVHAKIDSTKVEALAWEREQTAATGLGNGVAIPHARLAGLTAPVAVVGVSDAGVSFDAPDGLPAHVIFLLVTPEADRSIQLELSAEIARLFRDPASLEKLLRARTFTEFLAALKTSTAR